MANLRHPFVFSGSDADFDLLSSQPRSLSSLSTRPCKCLGQSQRHTLSFGQGLNHHFQRCFRYCKSSRKFGPVRCHFVLWDFQFCKPWLGLHSVFGHGSIDSILSIGYLRSAVENCSTQIEIDGYWTPINRDTNKPREKHVGYLRLGMLVCVCLFSKVWTCLSEPFLWVIVSHGHCAKVITVRILWLAWQGERLNQLHIITWLVQSMVSCCFWVEDTFFGDLDDLDLTISKTWKTLCIFAWYFRKLPHSP